MKEVTIIWPVTAWMTEIRVITFADLVDMTRGIEVKRVENKKVSGSQ